MYNNSTTNQQTTSYQGLEKLLPTSLPPRPKTVLEDQQMSPQ